MNKISPVKLNATNIKPKTNNVNKIIIFTIFIALISVVVGVSYAYFSSTSNNDDNQKLSIENGTMELTYNDCAESNQNDCANITGDLKPGESVSKTFSVKNTGTLDTSFKIVFTKSSNTFVDNELVYTLYSNDYNTKLSNGIVPYGDKQIIIFIPKILKPVKLKVIN